MAEENFTLSELYPSLEMRYIVRVELRKLFDRKFLMLIDECSSFRTYLLSPLRFYIEELASLFIERGLVLDSAEDLEMALDKLGYLKFEKFRKAKANFEKVSKIFKIIKEKHVQFKLDNDKLMFD